MKRFLRPPVLVGVGTITLGATTFVIIRMFGLSLLLGVLIVLSFVLIGVIFLLLRELRAAKAADEIEQSISRSADRAIERSTPGQEAQLRDLKSDLMAAISALKSSRGRGRNALSVLPWYMVIGPEGSGKSSLVSRSGLHFPLKDAAQRPRAVRGVGGTRDLEWWLSEEAVLLDMGGRTLRSSAEFEDSDDWLAFLEVLRKQRKQTPLNGVIVTASIDELTSGDEAASDNLAVRIRERLRELVQHLGVVFPVYVVFTQCDRLAGFSEFFGDLDSQARQQPWGATVSPERSRTDEPSEIFDAEFEQLRAAFSDRRLRRLADVPDPVQRARAFAFPLQMEHARGAMRRFVKALFQSARGDEAPLLRGFYMVSSTQEGESVDHVMRAATEGLELAATAPPDLPTGDEPHFIHELFTRVVFPDAALATSSGHAQARSRRGRYMVFAALSVVFLAVTVLLGALAMSNSRLIGGVGKAAEEVAQRVTPDAPLMENLDALDELRAKVVVVDSLTRRKPLWRVMGAYSGDVLLEPAQQLYTEKMLEVLLAPGFNDIESRLGVHTDTGSGEFLSYYYLFRAWRLLGEPKQLEPADAALLSRELSRTLSSRLAFASPEDRERFPNLVRQHMDWITARPEWLERLAPAYYRLTDPELLSRAAARVRETWDSSQFYEQMIEETRPGTTPATLASMLGEVPLILGSYDVPGPYTLAGWKDHVAGRIDWYREQMQRDWVVAEAFDGNPPDLADEMLMLYSIDYVDHWLSFMEGVQAVEPSDMVGAAEFVNVAAQGGSPILQVVRAVGEQTSLGVDPSSPVARVQTDFAMAREFFETPAQGGAASRVGAFISRLFDKDGENRVDQSQTPSSLYQAELRAVYEQVLEAAQPGAPAGNLRALMTFGDESTNSVKAAIAWVEALAGHYPEAAASEATSRLLLLPITGARSAAMGGVGPELNRRWHLLVLQPFERTLSGKYPVTDATQEASLFDFTEFFRPGGTFWAFYESQLKDFVREDGSPFNPEDPETPLSEDFLACLRQAYEIREAYFSIDPGTPTQRFSVRTSPPIISGPHVNVRWLSLDVGGTFATYQMGAPVWQELVWPGEDPAAGAALRAQTGGGPAAESINHPGPWGLFRLLDAASLESGEGGLPSATWTLRAGESQLEVQYLFQPATPRHTFRPGLLRFHLPQTL